MPPHTLLVLPGDVERRRSIALTPYTAGLAETSILRPKRRFPPGGYLRPKVLKHILGRALESQRTKGDCREAMKTKGKFRFSAAHSNLTTLQTNINVAQAVRSITLAQQLKHSSAAPTNHNNIKAVFHPTHGGSRNREKGKVPTKNPE
jgi:hypothetical protein